MPLHFELVTPERLVRSEDVHMVVVPGSEGDFGVLEGHAPFMSTIRRPSAGPAAALKSRAASVQASSGVAVCIRSERKA